MKPVHPAKAECWSLQVGAVVVAQRLQHTTTGMSYSHRMSCKPLILPWQISKDRFGVIAGETRHELFEAGTLRNPSPTKFLRNPSPTKFK